MLLNISRMLRHQVQNAPSKFGRAPQIAGGITPERRRSSEELEAIEIESTHMIEVDSFVPCQQIDQRFFDIPATSSPTRQLPRRRLR